MKIIKEIQKTVSEIVDIICNKCGESCNLNSQPDSLPDFGGLIDAWVSVGYFSKVLCDGDSYEFSLCEGCVADLMRSFKISAFQGNHLFPETEDPLTQGNHDKS